MNNWSKFKWHTIMSIFAFASVISFFQINSYFADKHHMNGLFGFLGIGIVLGLIALVCLGKVMDNYSKTRKDR